MNITGKFVCLFSIFLIATILVFSNFNYAFSSHSTLSVDITDDGFSPKILHIGLNDKVIWKNTSSEKQMIVPHPNHVRSGGFTLEPDEELSHVFNSKWAFYYFSLKNPEMRGVIVIDDAEFKNLDSEDISTFQDGLVFSENVVYSSPHAIDDINCAKNDDCLIPSTIRIEVGETVHWKHYSPGTWSKYGGWVEPSFGFEVPKLPLGRSSHTFTEAGVYHYFYQLAPYITGTVIVENPHPVTPETISIPDKFRDIVIGWHYKERPELDFFFIVRYLANNGIIEISETGNQKIPSWFEITAVWWSEEKISDKEFIYSIKNLVDRGIIQF